jgi:hypothetical protein
MAAPDQSELQSNGIMSPASSGAHVAGSFAFAAMFHCSFDLVNLDGGIFIFVTAGVCILTRRVKTRHLLAF